MSIDVKQTEEIIETARSFTARQIAVIIFIVIGSVSSVFWIENRYAKIKEINERFERSQQQLESAHFLTLEMFSLLPEAQRKQIIEKLNLSKSNRNKSAE